MEDLWTAGFETGVERVTEQDLSRFDEALQEYIQGKQAFSARVRDEERWYQVQHDQTEQLDILNRSASQGLSAGDTDMRIDRVIRSRSSLLFSAMWGHHNDDMDNVPSVTCLPREQSDEPCAEVLSKVMPVILQRARFVDAYSKCCWDKIKHGVSAYGVFWDADLADGLGDVRVSHVDVLSLFWQPGIRELEESAYLFILSDMRRDALLSEYPQLEQAVKGSGTESWHDTVWPGEEQVDRSKIVRITDVYYRKRNGQGRQVTHLCKYAMGHILYASENDPAYAEDGYYAHGRYPVVVDTLYPYTDTIGGFGMIAVGRGTMSYIEHLDERIAEYLDWSSRVRYWAKTSMGVDPVQFCDPDRRIVEVEGDISDEQLRQINVTPIDSMVLTVREAKAQELKEICSARDMSNGSSSGGVTAASAIAALQEAGNKGSRDELGSAYRSLEQVAQLIIELIRQFYTEARVFRIVSPDGTVSYQPLDNSGMQAVPTGYGADGQELIRRPVFDVEVRAAKMSPYSQVSQNTTMMEMFSAGVFSPQMADQALIMLDGMDFPGIDQLRENIRNGQTTYSLLMQAIGIISQTTGAAPEAVLAALTGGQAPVPGDGSGEAESGSDVADGVAKARTPMQERYAATARADTDKGGRGAEPR